MGVKVYTNHGMNTAGGKVGMMSQKKSFANTQEQANGSVKGSGRGANVKSPVDSNNDPQNGSFKIF